MKNFEIGDIVVDLSPIAFWDNFYHAESYINRLEKLVVTEVDRYGYFSFSPYHKLSDDSSDRGVFYDDYVAEDKTGITLSGNVVGNLTKRPEQVLAYVERKFFGPTWLKVIKSEENDIAALESQIKAIQQRIDNIRRGLRPHRTHPELVEREFLMANENRIKKFLTSDATKA